VTIIGATLAPAGKAIAAFLGNDWDHVQQSASQIAMDAGSLEAQAGAGVRNVMARANTARKPRINSIQVESRKI